MPTQQQLFCLFSFRGRSGLSSLPRGFEGGGKKAEAAEAKKTKKKYAIRDSNPENLLGRQKCYPYTNGVFPTSFSELFFR